jgi:formylglycine-generating enzyme required for sulfatase activity
MAIGIGHTETWNSETTPSTVFKDKKLYLWGDQYPPPPGSGNFSDQSRKAKAPSKEAKIGYIDGYDDGFPTTAPVMSFKPNSFGLYDLGGNVVEWCEDWFDNLRKHRVQRGLGCGHWWEGHIPELFLASTRTAYPAGSRKGTFGFRCVVEVQHTSQPSAVGLNPAPVIQSKPASPELAPISKSTASVPNASLVPKQPPEFLALEQQYRAALEKQVVPAVTEYAKTLLASYRNALDRAARTLGISSTDATALRAETQRLATDPTVPDADPPGTPQSLTTLRNTFRQAVATFRAEKEAPLKAIYDKQVAELLAQRAKNPHLATKDSPFINGLKMTFVPVPGTKVLMCIHETRNKDYGRFADSNKDTNNKWRNPMTWDAVSISEGAENPVLNVSFEDAMAFCRWLRDQEGITYRLPSDREWSQAVGIAEGEVDNVHPSELNKTAKSHWPWGTTWPPPEGAGNIPDGTYAKRYPTAFFIKEYEDGYITTAPVMSFKPNSFGIYDLAGNAEEICDTWLTAENQRKVVRGGGWHLPMRRAIKNDLRSGWRTGIAPGERSNSTGFRCVVDLAASGAAPSSAQAASKSNPPSTSATAPTPAPVSPTTPTMVRRGGVDRFDSARFSSGLVMFETNLESQIMPAASSSYTPLLLQDLYTACVELEIEQCQKTAARAADLSWFEAERERVRSKSYPNGSNDPAQPDRLQKMRAAYWQAAVEIDRRLDAQKK